jgi:hypothetical protein
MPAIGVTDPANLKAKARAELGFSQWLEQPQRILPATRFGGGGYPVWHCELQLARFHVWEGIDISLSSIYQWNLHPKPFHQTGNGPWISIVGVNLLNLVTYITAWPDATLDEMAAFIHNKGGDLYSHQTISKCLGELDVTKKRVSTEGYQALRPDVQFHVWSFGSVLLLLVYSRCLDRS